MSNKEYTFELGEKEKRVYKGERLRPLSGLQLSTEVFAILANMISTSVGQEASEDNREIIIMLKLLSNLDHKVFFDIFKRIMKNTLIFAREDGQTKKHYLTADEDIDAWFSKYPEDMLEFGVNIIKENITPFLSKKIKEISTLMTGVGLD